MWNNIRAWFRDNDLQLTWFFIGLFTAQFFQDVGRGEWTYAILDLLLIVLNYVLRPRR